MKQYIIQAKTGKTIHVRHLQSGDAPYLVDLFEHMSSESRYRRFLQPMDNPSSSMVWREAERIVTGDVATHDGLIAFTDLPNQLDAPVAVARYVVIEPGVAEIALSVRDDMQNQGLGSQLLQMLAQFAREAGLQKWVGTAQNDNKGIWQLLKKLPHPMVRTPEGIYSMLEIDLTKFKEDEIQRTARN